MTKETKIKKQIKKFLSLNGWFSFSILQGMGAHKGISDMIALKDGRVLFLEVKTERGKQSDNQMQFEHDIEWSGGEYYVVRSVEDMAEIIGVKLLV